MKLFTKLAFVLTLVLSITNVNAQLKDFGIKVGLQFNGVMPATEFEDNNGYSLSSYLARGFIRFELTDFLNAELGAGYGNLKGDDFNFTTNTKGAGEYSTAIIPFDVRLLLAPFNLENWNPYLYAGFGTLNYNVGIKPSVVSPIAVEDNGWTSFVPFGIGTEIKLSEGVILDLTAGATSSFSENLNFFKFGSRDDGYFNIGAGITFSSESMNSDRDKDGLTKGEELDLATDPNNPDTDVDGLKDGAEVKEHFTDPKNPDTDGEGLKDGEEVTTYNTNPTKADDDNDGLKDYDEVITHKTDPLKPDTDGDGLNDGEEVVKHKTDPLKADTDNDGLSDGNEVSKYLTDPLKIDTDGDGLNDGDEVSKYKTDPTKADSDMDELSDGEEVLKHKTDPLKTDTDGGTINDGVEVKRGTDPLKADDDIMKIGVAIVLEGITFETNKFDITPESEKILTGALNTLKSYPDIVVEISGHTDNVGNDSYNQKLSKKRADAVKGWLISKGIAAERMTTVGYGEEMPRVANDSPENKRLNRRIEFKRIK